MSLLLARFVDYRDSLSGFLYRLVGEYLTVLSVTLSMALVSALVESTNAETNGRVAHCG